MPVELEQEVGSLWLRCARFARTAFELCEVRPMSAAGTDPRRLDLGDRERVEATGVAAPAAFHRSAMPIAVSEELPVRSRAQVLVALFNRVGHNELIGGSTCAEQF